MSTLWGALGAGGGAHAGGVGGGEVGVAGASRQPASEIGTQRPTGVWSNPATRWSGAGRTPLTPPLPSPGFPALVMFRIGPDISHGRMGGECNEDLCVFRARLGSQCRETRSLLPLSIFHSRFGERSRAQGGGGGES